VSVSLSEAEVHWRDFFGQLQGCGLSGVWLLISDNHAGMKAAREARFPGVPWQRCQFHEQQNAGHYVPRIEMRREAAADLSAIFESTDRLEAEPLRQAVDKYARSASELSAWMEANVAESFTVFAFPETHRRRLQRNCAVRCKGTLHSSLIPKCFLRLRSATLRPRLGDETRWAATL
jgi:transposase-like protein